jgi:hypothetical protein
MVPLLIEIIRRVSVKTGESFAEKMFKGLKERISNIYGTSVNSVVIDSKISYSSQTFREGSQGGVSSPVPSNMTRKAMIRR